MASPDCPLLVCSRLSEQSKSLRLNRAKCELLFEAFAQAREIYERTPTLDSVKEEFHAVVKRFQHLVDESPDPNKWLLKALELWECSQHFVEALMDVWWSARIMIAFNRSEALESQVEARFLQLSEEQARIEKKHQDDKKDLSDRVKVLLRPGVLREDSDAYQLARLLHGRFEGFESPLPPGSASYKFKSQISNRASDKHGNFGTVVPFTWVYGKRFVVKTSNPCDVDCNMSFQHEFEVLDKHRSPYIVVVVGYWKVPKLRSRRNPWNKHKVTLCPYLVMEAMDCDLEEFISEYRKSHEKGHGFSVLETIKLMLPVSKALRFLHARDVAHRDIKLQNIMCSNTASGQIDDVVVKLIDFGEASTNVSNFPIGEGPGKAGTNGFIDPDMCKPQVQGGRRGKCTDLKSADVFSFAMVFVELLTGRSPWEEAGVQRGKEVQDKLNRGERPPLPGDIPPYVRFIVESCWSADPFLRPSFDDICSMLQYAKLLLSNPTLVASRDFFSYLDATYVRRCYITEQD